MNHAHSITSFFPYLLFLDNRLFHLDLPPPEPGQFLAKRSPAALAREQNIRDKTVHGRGHTDRQTRQGRVKQQHRHKRACVTSHAFSLVAFSVVCSSEYDPISNARIQTIPPSEQAQMQFKLSGPSMNTREDKR